jgi:hypothetical protein
MRPFLFPLLLIATPALAQSPRDLMFPSDATCYLRHYGAAHLASHPAQLVTDIALGPDQPSWNAQELTLRLGVSLRGTSDYFLSYAYCENTGGALSCHLEGDAGWFTLEPAAKGGLLMTTGRGGIGFEGAGGMFQIGGSASDDESFLIPPVPADSCP